METKLREHVVEHEVVTVDFMNQNIIPLETISQKVDFCDRRITSLQDNPEATLEQLSEWLGSREDFMVETNEMANKLFERMIQKIWHRDKENEESEKGELIEKSTIGVIDRYKLVFEFIGRVHLSEEELKNFERELAGNSNQASLPETAEPAEKTS